MRIRSCEGISSCRYSICYTRGSTINTGSILEYFCHPGYICGMLCGLWRVCF